MWSHIEAQRAQPAFRWGWVVASVLVLVAASATAAVVVYANREDERRVVDTTAPRESAREVPQPVEATREAPPGAPPPQQHAKAKHRAGVPVSVSPVAPVEIAPPPAPSPEPPVTVKPIADLFIAGSEARAHGDLKRAAEHYAQFVADHAADSRAPVAAMEVCRIHADQLGDDATALTWAQRALALGARGSVREDARSREVQLLGRLGRSGACGAARDAFVNDYPVSVQTERVRQACQR